MGAVIWNLPFIVLGITSEYPVEGSQGAAQFHMMDPHFEGFLRLGLLAGLDL